MARMGDIGWNFFAKDNVSNVLDRIGKNAKHTETNMQKFGKKVSKAFDVAAASAIAAGTALAVSAVKGAIEDEKASAQLAKTLKNTTHATDAQVKAVDDYISKTQNASGVLDDELRPSLARLVRSTNDIGKAQKLQALAMDISASTGKDLETVSNALAKANDGNTTALKKLGISLGPQAQRFGDLTKAQKALVKAQTDASQALDKHGAKSKEYAKAQDKVAEKQKIVNDMMKSGVDWTGELSKAFGGALDTSLQTTSGKLKVMNARWDDAKEKMGYALIDGLKPLIDYAGSTEGQQFINDFMGGFQDAAEAVSKALPKIMAGMKKIGDVASGFNLDWSTLLDPGLLAAVAAFKYMPGPIQLKAIAAIAAWAAFDGGQSAPAIPDTKYDTKKVFNPGGQFSGPGATGQVSVGGMTLKSVGTVTPSVSYSKHAKGGIVTKPHLGLVGEAGPEAIIPLNKARGLGGTNVYITVEGSLIAERDLVLKLRNELAQLMRRQAAGTAAFGI